MLSTLRRFWSRGASDPVKESTPGRIRTCNPRFRRPMRYPIAPRAPGRLPILRTDLGLDNSVAAPFLPWDGPIHGLALDPETTGML
jgi:hypothetical protein